MLIYILCSLAWLVIVIMTTIQITRRDDLTDLAKRAWIAVIVIAPVAGLLIYYFASKPKRLI